MRWQALVEVGVLVHIGRLMLAASMIMIAIVCSGSEARASSITLVETGSARAVQHGVLRVHRDAFKKGGWGFTWTDPAGWASGDVWLAFSMSDIPDGSVLTSAMLSWEFSGLDGNTGASYGANLPGLPGRPGARAPRCLGVGCSFATIKYWASGKEFRASEVELAGAPSYSIPTSSAGNPRGSLDLLSLYGSEALLENTVRFRGTVLDLLGRPFFGTEGRNADTEFDVGSWAAVNVRAMLQVTFTPPLVTTQEPIPVPEPATLVMLGSGMLFLSRIARRRKGS